VKKGAYTYAVTFDGRTPIVTTDSRPTPVPVKPPVTVDPTPPVTCPSTGVLDTLERRGDELMSAGSYADALAMFDKAVKCRPRPVKSPR
jgi:hypothetical protein